LLDFSGPLGGEGRAMWRGDEGRGRKEREKEGSERSGLSPSKKIPEGTHASLY